MTKPKSKVTKKIETAKKKIVKKTEELGSKINQKKKNWKKPLLMILVTLGIIFAVTIIAFSLYIITTAPEFDTSKLYSTEASTIYDKNGNVITKTGTENRVVLSYQDFPQVLIDALIATEDSRFFQHNGVDAARFIKASVKQVLGNSDAGGASTLTMQLAKNTYNGKESKGIKGIIRKFTDIYMAVFKIEKKYTKEEIIEFYLNSQWMDTGGTYFEDVYGVEQACQTFFGKSAKDLTLPEAAIIVGMFNNPSYFDPVKNPEKVQARMSTVLALMVKHGYITQEEKEAAEKIRVESLLKTNVVSDKSTPYQAFIDYVLNEVKQTTGADPKREAMDIYTTLDPSIQDIVNDLQANYNWRDDKIQMGMAITSVKDGSIIAFGAGRNYQKGNYNYAVDAKRQPGSGAKPILDYGPLFEYNSASPSSYFFDEPYTFTNGPSFKNYDGKFKGLISLEEALIDSRNIPAVQAFQQTELQQKENFAHSLGIDYGTNLYEAFAIGGFDTGVSPLQMSAAYAAFARGGYYIKPYSFTKIVFKDNNEVYENKYEKEQVMSEETAYLINYILTQGGARNVGGKISISGTDVAAKGGTTTMTEEDANRYGYPTNATPDHWNNVYTPSYSISLWTGYPNKGDGYLTSSIGGTLRRALMQTVANKILPKNEKFEVPSGITTVTVEKNTFPLELASEYTPESEKMNALYKKGMEPNETSTRFAKLDAPTNGKGSSTGSVITLSWDSITTPDALNKSKIETELNQYFQENFKTFKDYNATLSKYVEYLYSYNTSQLGSIGYMVYLQTESGLQELGYTNNTNFSYMSTGSSSYTFVVKAAYSNIKSNMSDGLTITVGSAGSSTIEKEINITINGKNPTCILVDSTFKDIENPITIKDKNKEDITSTLSYKTNTLDTSKTGTLKLIYEVTYNNQKYTATRTVNVCNSCKEDGTCEN